MSKKKTRKASAMAPVIRHRVDSSATGRPDSRQPDPDQPPGIGTTGRPSIYSEWLNNTPRPQARSAWLNSSIGDTSALRAAMDEVALGPKPGTADGGNAPGFRKRLSTRARKLAQAERLQLDPDELSSNAGMAVDPSRQLAPTVPARQARLVPPSGNAPRSTRIMPTMSSGDQTAEPGRGGTPPGRRATAGRVPVMAEQPTVRMTAAARFAAGPKPSARQTTAHAALTGQATAKVPAVRKTAAPAMAKASDSGVLIRGARKPAATGAIVPRRLRPPSFVMQGVVALATVIVLMGVLTVSSPLGYGAAVNGTFQAYANSFHWIPTATPTPTLVPVNTTFSGVPPSPGQQVVVDEIRQVFGQYAQGALNVSHCESGWDPTARNPYPVGNSHAEGVFQILFPSTWNTTSYASRNPYDYDANIRAAWEIFHRDGNSWAEWECKP